MISETQEFLDYYLKARSKQTHKSYKRGLALFEEYYKKSCDEALKQRRLDVQNKDRYTQKRFTRELEKFHKWLLDQNYSINTSRTMTLGILQLFRYYGMPISDVAFKTTITTKTFIPSIEQLRKMFQIADLREKVILSLGLDLAWRIGDFVSIKKEDIPDLEEKTPIPFERITEKESVISSTFISNESVQLLKTYIPTLKTHNPYLFPSNGKTHLKDEAINRTLKKLAIEANIKIPKKKRFTFHSFRKRFLSTCYNNNVESEISKLLVGKAIDKSMETYLGDVKLRNVFVQVRQEALSLTNTKAKSEIEMKDVEIAKLRKEIEMLKYAMKGMAETFKDSIEEKAKGMFTEPEREQLEPLKLLQAMGKLETEKEKREYDKLQAETNSFNHET